MLYKKGFHLEGVLCTIRAIFLHGFSAGMLKEETSCDGVTAIEGMLKKDEHYRMRET